MRAVLALPPPEIGGWRRHFERHPPDACEALLSLLVRAHCAGGDGEDPIVDADLRPWRYDAREAEEQRDEARGVVTRRREAKADAEVTRIMG